MKKALLTLALVAYATSVFAVDGTITFYNRNYPGSDGSNQDGTLGHGGIFRPDGTGAGAGITAGLFLASNLSTPLATTTFRTTSSLQTFLGTQDVAVPGVSPNNTANLVIRAWSTSAGSFAAAQTTDQAFWGEQAFTSAALGGPNPPNPDVFTPGLAGFTGFTMTQTIIPEPSTIALGAFGIGALLLRRRK